MREINFNGYIDDEVWYGDEVTPEGLRAELYGEDGANNDDVLLRINSYGGSTVAAARMYDMIREYPGNVDAVISGVAASAATVVASAARRVQMTPGALYMVHDPSTVAYGNEKDLGDAISLLRAVKEGILNVYEAKCGNKTDRATLAKLMTDTSWLSANEAFCYGFVDEVTGMPGQTSPTNAANEERKAVACVDIDEAKRKVAAYYDRQKPKNAQRAVDAVRSFVDAKAAGLKAESSKPAAGNEEPAPKGVPVALLKRKLDLYDDNRRKR